MNTEPLIPLPERRFCQFGRNEGMPACRTPLAQANKGDLCFRHAQMVQMGKINRIASSPTLPKRRPLPDCIRPIRRVFPKAAMPAAPMTAPKPAAAPAPVAPTAAPAPVVPRVEPEVEPAKEEVTPVSKTGLMEPVTECAVMDCHTPLAANNNSGRCEKHWYVKKGMVMKDGSIPRPVGVIGTPQPPLRERKPKTPKPRKFYSRAKVRPPSPDAETAAEKTAPIELPPVVVSELATHVSLKVPVEALDRFWARLALPEKTRIIEREMFGGW